RRGSADPRRHGADDGSAPGTDLAGRPHRAHLGWNERGPEAYHLALAVTPPRGVISKDKGRRVDGSSHWSCFGLDCRDAQCVWREEALGTRAAATAADFSAEHVRQRRDGAI